MWMRRGTQWLGLALATMFLALIAYYLLPLWWAQALQHAAGAVGAVPTGLALGLLSVAGALGALVGAAHGERPLRLGATILAGVLLAAVVLTLAIGAAPTDPLAQARAIWGPGGTSLAWATVVGALLTVVAVLAALVVRAHRAGEPTAPRPDENPLELP